MKKIVMSQEVKKMMPIWEDFIIKLGYSKREGYLFALGYAQELSKLPILLKIKALDSQYDPCMEAGFLNARINEKQALKRFKQKEPKSAG